MMQNKVVWLMGGSGSGKTSASVIFREMGFTVIDADKVARSVLETGKPGFNETVSAFGKDILLQDGSINRKKLGEEVFANSEKLRILNGITHKYIKRELDRIISESNNSVLIDAALPPKGFCECDRIIAVTAPRKVRIKRITERDGISEKTAENRIASQLSDTEYSEMADMTFQNCGSIEDLKAKIKKWCIDEKII